MTPDLGFPFFYMQFSDEAKKLPGLWNMMRDIYAVQATSSPVERVFSIGADLISKKCNWLMAETIQSCMCLHSWWGDEICKAPRGANKTDDVEVVDGDESGWEDDPDLQDLDKVLEDGPDVDELFGDYFSNADSKQTILQ